jgi:hypothetical protein
LGNYPSGLRDVFLKGFGVVGVFERAVEGVAALLEGDPLFTPECPAQAEDGVVEAAAELGG